MRYSIESRERKYIKGCGFLSFAKQISNKYSKKIIDTAIKQEQVLQKLLLKKFYKRQQKLFDWKQDSR